SERRDFSLTGEMDGEPNQHGQGERKQLEPKVMENQMPKEGDHLTMLVEVVVVTVSDFGTMTRGLTRSVVQERIHPTQLRERAGETSMEVRKARNSSALRPRTRLLLYA